MINHIRVMDRETFIKEFPKRVESGEDVIAISIYSTGDDAPIVSKGCVWSYHFDDANPRSIYKGTAGLKAFTVDQAEDIVQLIEHFHWEYNGDVTLIVHCDAGICRSGAVARFAQDMCKTEDFDQYNAHIRPNEWVLNLLYLQILNEGWEKGF